MNTKKESFKVKIIDILKNFRIWILIFFIIFSITAVNYTTEHNYVVISGVIPGSFANQAGIEFDSNINPRNFERILFMDTTKINTIKDYYNFIDTLKKDSTFTIRTNYNKIGYKITLDNSTNSNKSIENLIGLSINDAATSNIKLGIELEGGSRLILKPEKNLSNDEFEILIDNLQNRLDVYGASGTKVNKLEDAFSNEKFIIIESLSSNKNDIYELISRQGKFEATIGNETVFTGNNVLKVFNDPNHAGLERCGPSGNGEFVCTFSFSIEIDSKGGDNFFEKTSNSEVMGNYLADKICFNLDGQQITCLNIATTFKYNKITNPKISVSGNPAKTEAKAIISGKKEMKFLQTILSTQSLSTKLDVVQSYSISSSEGEKLLNNALKVGLIALLLVASIVALRYRHFSIFFSIIFTLICEVIIVFGFAAFMKLSIDLAAIGGLIASIGTGVDDQIIITDEYFRKTKEKKSAKKRIKTALYIIMITYLTTVAAMFPLYFAGLNILKGFAFMIIIGVSIGVFITRPAYATILRILLTNKEERNIEKNDD